MAWTSRAGRSWRASIPAALGLLAAAMALAGCGATIGDHLPTVVGGLPEGTPARPSQPGVFPAVHDMPPPRADPLLSDAERTKLEGELMAARERAAAAAKPPGGAEKP